MALSVLTINPNSRANSADSHALFDSEKNDYISFGNPEKMYAIKHAIEDAEQQSDNLEWMLEYISKHSRLFIKAGYSPFISVAMCLKNLKDNSYTDPDDLKGVL